MTNNLPQAIAALLPTYSDIVGIEGALAKLLSDPHYGKGSLAFECHKALRSRYEVSITTNKQGVVTYLYFTPFKPLSHITGKSKEDELAIFAAVSNWFDKGGHK